ncbi:MAG: MerR family transcriptional regulator [Chloroflexota bacterium]
MPHTSQSPTYNLKAVLKETGLKADVLRAWERRYDLPRPERTSGGHRLYSEYDIETVKWLRARQAEGLSISRAAELWKEIVAEGADPLEKYSTAGSPSPRNHPFEESLPIADTRIENLRQSWLEAALNFNGARADEILSQAFAVYPVETVCTQVIQQGLGEIGKYWYLDQASVQQEHFASALASRRLEALITAAPEPTRKQSLLMGCPSGERHTLPILMFSLLLRRRGFRVVYLGADVPNERLEETVATIQPNLTVLAAQQLTTAASLRSAALIMRKRAGVLAYGGLIFNRIPELRQRIPAHFLGENLETALASIEGLVSDPAALPPIKLDTSPDRLRALARLYKEKRPALENALYEEIRKLNFDTTYTYEANIFFGNALAASLELGDPAYLEADFEWVHKLLTGRKVSPDNIKPYLEAYRHAIHITLGAAGKPITEWIGAYVMRQKEYRREFSDIIGGA